FFNRDGLVLGIAPQQRGFAPAAAGFGWRQRPLALFPDGGRRADADAVAQVERRQRVAEISLVAESRISASDAQVQARPVRRLNRSEGDLRLGPDFILLRNAFWPGRFRIVGPLFGKIEVITDRQARPLIAEREGDGDLAFADLSQLPQYWRATPTELLPCF